MPITLISGIGGAGINADGSISSGGITAVAPGALPANTVAPAITGNTVEQECTVDTGTWTGSPVSYQYQWLLNGIDVFGATTNAYTPPASAEGDELRCVVTATNIYGSSLVSTVGVTLIAAGLSMLTLGANQLTLGADNLGLGA